MYQGRSFGGSIGSGKAATSTDIPALSGLGRGWQLEPGKLGVIPFRPPSATRQSSQP